MILGGELSWTESQIICVVMKSFLSSCGDLSNLYSPLTDSSNKQIITTLIYCVTQRKKVQVLDCVAKDRREPEGGPVAHSPFSWSYHSQNGKKEKEDVVVNYGDVSALLSAVLWLKALVKIRTIFGESLIWDVATHPQSARWLADAVGIDPSTIFQMVSWCSWDGNSGLAIMFFEKTCINEKNKEAQFKSGDYQSNDNWMDLQLHQCV